MRPFGLRLPAQVTRTRRFSTSVIRHEIRDLAELPRRVAPRFQETSHHDLLALQWPGPLRNVLVVPKEGSKSVDAALKEYIDHVTSTYPGVSILLEPHIARSHHERLDIPIYTSTSKELAFPTMLEDTVDLVTTLGGDGTILHASSLFATARHVPPVLSFSMGTLGFLGEWKFQEYKRAFREVYMSGSGVHLGDHLRTEEAKKHERFLTESEAESQQAPKDPNTLSGWSSVRGKTMGSSRSARVLLRNRLKVGIYSHDGSPVAQQDPSMTLPGDSGGGREGDVYAMNEVLIHRGRTPHLSIISISVGGRFLTEAVADGMLISTPTGSTAYSLSAGGSIVHPLVSSLLLTPISPRSLSFRPLVLPANTPITMRLSKHNRGQEAEISIDGVRRDRGLEKGMEVRVVGEDIMTGARQWTGGVPSIVRAGGPGGVANGEDHWVGGLNGLLKFNYPFGEDG